MSTEEFEIFYYAKDDVYLQYATITQDKLNQALSRTAREWVVIRKETVPPDILPVLEQCCQTPKPPVTDDIREELRSISSEISVLKDKISDIEDNLDDLINKI